MTIHPWADGNGRTSRLLMNLLQMEYGVLPTKVLKEDKAEYIQALIDTREAEDVNIFVDCMTKLHCRHLKHDIEQYRKSMSEDVAVNTKYLAERFGKNRKTIQRDLTVLTEMHLIHWTGSDKSGYWEIL